jgi:O-antigen/teichoic acid export membrane protein
MLRRRFPATVQGMLALRFPGLLGASSSLQTLAYIVGQLIFFGSSFLFSVILASLLGPGNMGIWQSALLVSSYGMVLMCGTVNGMARELPYLRGKEDNLGADRAVAGTLQVLLTVISALLVLLFFVEILGRSPLWLFLGLCLLLARLINNFSLVLLRSLQLFPRLGLHQGASGLLLLGSLFWVSDSPSLLRAAAAMALSLSVVTLLCLRHTRLSWPDTGSIYRLASIGLPIMLAGVLYSLLSTVDRFIVLGLMDFASLGLYTPAIQALGLLVIIPGLVGNVMYPKLAKEYGHHADIQALMPTVMRALKINVVSTYVLALVFVTAFYFLVIPMFLPAFMSGRNPMAIAMISALFLPVAQSFGDLFNVIGMQKRYLANMLAAFITNALVGYSLVVFTDLGLSGVAMGTVVGAAAFASLQLQSFFSLRHSLA